MKNKLITYKNIGLMLLLMLALSSCEILDKRPLESLYEDEVWNNEAFAEMYLNGIYYDVLPEFAAGDNQGMSDETGKPSNNQGSVVTNNFKKIYGLLEKDDVGDLSRDFYAIIVKINRFLNDIDEKGNLPFEYRRLLKGQAYFLRAWAYWQMVNLYGGIPMVLDVPEIVLDGDIPEEVFAERNKTSECIDFIVNDLDTAFASLPISYEQADDYGRITRGAALALKGRVLLFWASPQYNPDNEIEKWQRAYDANKQALEILETDGYGLHPSFKELFEDCLEKTKEAVFVRVYNTSAGNTHGYDKSVRPALAGQSGGGQTNNPTWEFVKNFPLTDGFPITDTSGNFKYNKVLYWQNRDPRFYFTVAYNGCTWPLLGKSDYKIWTYYLLNTDGSLKEDKNNNHLSSTGFFCRKYVNPAIPIENVDKVGTDWMEIRFAEVLLNFAECANELEGKSDEVREALNKVRNEREDIKAGMDYIDKHLDNKTIMREIIMTERMVEFAFENKRYWDLRRRNMFAEDLGPNIKKLNQTVRNRYRPIINSEGTSESELLGERDGLDFNDPVLGERLYNNKFKVDSITIDGAYQINFLQPEYNFFPVESANLETNPKFVQNIFWEGTFDPYE